MRSGIWLAGALLASAGGASAQSTGTVAASTAAAPSAGSGQALSTSTLSGRGSIALAKGGNGVFDVEAQLLPDGSLSGRVVYVDGKANITVQSTSILSYTPGCPATIQGTADTSLGQVQFTVTALDGGKRKGSDAFSIQLFGGTVDYKASGAVRGGKITVRPPPCPAAQPAQ
jgi:hypothetical protein